MTSSRSKAGPFAAKTDGTGAINSRYLSYRVDEMQDSFLTLSMNADALRFITNVSPGRILVANITNFEALGDPGVLTVTVVNEGCISAKFAISARCNAGIAELTAKEASVAPGSVWSYTVPVHATSQVLSENWCSVTLYDAEGGQLDNWNSSFTTTATCICLGSCACDCDPHPVPVAHCVVESTVADSDTTLEAGERNGFSLKGVLDKFGLSMKGFVGILSGIAVLLVVICGVRCIFCTSKPCCSPQPPQLSQPPASALPLSTPSPSPSPCTVQLQSAADMQEESDRLASTV